jgi:membrane protein YdbS with pleckstrin-like domain
LREALRARLLRLLKVPARPAPPPGDPRLLKTFRAAPSYFQYSVAAWVLKQLSAALGLLFSYLFLQSAMRGVPFGYFGLIERFFILLYVLQLPFSFALLRLDFEMRWYMLSDRSLRIRHGILTVREQTMTFANIQNISIRQNPLQRLFGISTVAVRAAGGGGSQSGKGGKQGGDSHEATFEGVDEPEAIRTLIRERIRRHRDAGLGDPDEAAEDAAALPAGAAARALPAGSTAVSVAPATASARRLLDEVRALRGALAGS